jgi:predicted ATP-grasp superfamily ATP-dependent carboligase
MPRFASPGAVIRPREDNEDCPATMKKVLVLDANQRSALAVIRSLGRRAVHVTAADSTATTLGGSSRYCAASITYPSPLTHPAAFIDAVASYVRDSETEIVLPMSDITTRQILLNRALLEPAIVPCGSLEAFDKLTDKATLFRIATNLGITIPRTHFVDNLADLERQRAELRYPAVIKPFRSKIPSANGWISVSVEYARSETELNDLIRRNPHLQQHPFLIQEYIEGSGEGLFTVYNRGAPIALFAHKRLRERPPSGGVSALSESIALDPELVRAGTAILNHVQWHGAAMVEFRRSTNGRLYLMEVNARFWGSLQLSVDAGIDFPFLVYKLATGETPVAQNGYEIGIRNRWLLGDADHLYMMLKGKGSSITTAPTLVDRIKAISDFCRFFDPRMRFEVNRWDDFRPFVYELRNYLDAGRRSGQKTIAGATTAVAPHEDRTT